MAEHREIFVRRRGEERPVAEKAAELFDLMEKFAGYGFNKSHAAAYALLAYQTAYLKAHHPAAFMAANLSLAMDDTDKVQGLFEDGLANGLSCCRRTSTRRPTVSCRSTVKRYGYGLGASRHRRGGDRGDRRGAGKRALCDLFDFCHRVDKRIVNRRVVESLVRAGAFDASTPSRAPFCLGRNRARSGRTGRACRQSSKFVRGDTDTPVSQLGRINVLSWSEKEKLANEKTALGFYLSGHPFNGYAEDVRRFARTSLNKLTPQREIQLLAGIVYAIRTRMTRRGKMGVVVLDDGSARVELVLYNELFESVRAWLKEDQLVVAEAKVFNRGGEGEYGGELRISARSVVHLRRSSFAFCQANGTSLQRNGQRSQIKGIAGPVPRGPC